MGEAVRVAASDVWAAPLAARIRSEMKAQGVTCLMLMQLVRIGKNTLPKRFRRPSTFKVHELRDIGQVLGLSVADLVTEVGS